MGDLVVEIRYTSYNLKLGIISCKRYKEAILGALKVMIMIGLFFDSVCNA